MSWACFQLGSREHYAVPVALCSANKLEVLVTDTWLSRRVANGVRPWFPALAGRRRDDIHDNIVVHRTAARLLLEAELRSQSVNAWSAAIRRNRWFGNWASKQLRQRESEIVFSYSYAALNIFRAAANQGRACVMSQVDPGPLHFEAVRDATRRYHQL